MARRFIYFQMVMAKKGPQYANCNDRQTSCTRTNAQPRLGCPNCEYTIQRKQILIDEADRELLYLRRGTRTGGQKWPRSYLLKTLIDVASLANSREGFDPQWTVVTAVLVGVYRDERDKRQSIERANTKPASNPAPDPDDEDYE
jgi:hypothetical protein